jgi:hypothetical protein
MRQSERHKGMSALAPALVGPLLVGLTFTATLVTAQPRAFPPRLDNYLTESVRLSRNQGQRLLNGKPLTKFLDADASKEVAVFGAVWVDAPIRRYVEAVSNIETFEQGRGFKVTKRISAPPRIDDFSALQLPYGDGTIASLRSTKQRLERVQ